MNFGGSCVDSTRTVYNLMNELSTIQTHELQLRANCLDCTSSAVLHEPRVQTYCNKADNSMRSLSHDLSHAELATAEP